MIRLVSGQEEARIVKLAKAGSTLSEIVKLTGKHANVVNQVCSAAGVQIRKTHEPFVTVPVEQPAAKYEMIPGESRLDYATRILRHEQRIVTERGVQYLDGKQLRAHQVMQTANRVLKSLGLPQIEGHHEWMA